MGLFTDQDAAANKLARSAIQSRMVHGQKIQEHRLNRPLRSIHEAAFNHYGRAVSILKMNGDSGIFAAKNHIVKAQQIEEHLRKTLIRLTEQTKRTNPLAEHEGLVAHHSKKKNTFWTHYDKVYQKSFEGYGHDPSLTAIADHLLSIHNGHARAQELNSHAANSIRTNDPDARDHSMAAFAASREAKDNERENMNQLRKYFPK